MLHHTFSLVYLQPFKLLTLKALVQYKDSKIADCVGLEGLYDSTSWVLLLVLVLHDDDAREGFDAPEPDGRGLLHRRVLPKAL